MKLISRRRAPAFLGCAGIFAASVVLAAPADAFPTRSWWYGELSVAKAQQVNKGSGVIVAVIDTGVQASLPDLGGQVLAGKSFTRAGDGRTDIPSPGASYFGHGTAIAGYIAGTGRGAGMVGIAPQAKILPVQVTATATDTHTDTLAQGIRWSVDHGAKILNISLSGQDGGCPAALQSAVDYAVQHDVIVDAGTGNSAQTPVGSPANCIGALGIGGTSDAKAFTAWPEESAGPELDFVAPADHMRDLLLTNQLTDPVAKGTSISTALVSGTFALLRSRFPHDSARQIVTRALYNVHNGFRGNVFAKRIDDRLGYGEILPSFALTDAPPRNAVNPLYDAIERHLKSTSSTPASSAPAASSSGAPSSSSGSKSSTGLSTGALVGIVAGVVVVVLLVVVVVARSRRRPPVRPYGPPGSYGPPGR